ncbi:MAG: hypothetical protein KJZ98_06280 [Burkholderiaceae bacterium]|nr:hypothetical protein [Burkholderiaceae bacterium]MEB2353424.1 hypothetical protein [Burkholderiaceae bacterium]
MARIIPEEIDAATRRGHAAREPETLELLERDLPDECTVYHGVHRARANARTALYGEIDFIVANRLGRLITIEQKNGPVSIGADDLIKIYGTGAKDIRAQVTRNLHNLMEQFGRPFPGRRLDIDHLLYLPDHAVDGSGHRPRGHHRDRLRRVDRRRTPAFVRRPDACAAEGDAGGVGFGKPGHSRAAGVASTASSICARFIVALPGVQQWAGRGRAKPQARHDQAASQGCARCHERDSCVR